MKGNNLEFADINICLIKPPNEYNLHPKEQQGLGILYVVAKLRKEGCLVKLVDLSENKINEIIKLIPQSDLYMFTACFLDLEMSHKVAEIIKKMYPKSKVVIGGFGPTASLELIDMTLFDSIVLGEGELASIDLVNDLKKNKLKKSYRKELMSEKELNSLPFPARDLLDYQGGKIFNFGREYSKGQSTGIITSRGCPYNCSFCASESLWLRKVRYRSVENVIDEIKEIIKQFGIFVFKIQDDTFVLNEERVLLFCGEMEKLNKEYCGKIVWRCYGGRVNLITKKMLVAMKNAGCKEIDFGIESGDQEILNLMRKNIKVKQAIHAIKLAKGIGLSTRAFMMVGLPGTTNKTAEKDIDFLEKAKPDTVNLAIFTPYPGSDIYTNPLKYGVKILDKPKNCSELYKFKKYNMHLYSRDPRRNTKSVIKLDNLSSEELETQKQKVIEYVINNKLLHVIK